MPRSLPTNPSVRFLQKEAKDIIRLHKKGDVTSCATLRYHYRFSRADDDEILKAQVTLQEAQHALSLDYGSKSWTDLTERANALAETDPPSADTGTLLPDFQRMASLGTLSAGIAHDFQNLLMGIQGHLSLMQIGREPTPQDREHFTRIERYIQTATDLIAQLLSICRGETRDTIPMDLNSLLVETGQVFSRTKREVVIHEAFEGDLWTVEGDRGQLGQVFLNLLTNAYQAMASGGEIRVETKNVELTEEHTQPSGMGPGRYIQASVSDSGIGMDRATQERIFEPFFTTKQTGKGSGLGLSSAYTIVKNHGGLISVDSKRGEGTTFSIFLPAID